MDLGSVALLLNCHSDCIWKRYAVSISGQLMAKNLVLMRNQSFKGKDLWSFRNNSCQIVNQHLEYINKFISQQSMNSHTQSFTPGNN